jgi:hypothetical protein
MEVANGSFRNIKKFAIAVNHRNATEATKIYPPHAGDTKLESNERVDHCQHYHCSFTPPVNQIKSLCVCLYP